DNLALPFRSDCFDAIISIAVIHHFASNERRAQALREMFRVLRVGGRIMVSVWAFEQEKKEYASQDSLIPWMYRGKTDAVFQRYYHLFRQGELEHLGLGIGCVELIDSIWDYDNWYCTFKKIEII
ncbi:MAG: methyltransferase domain-containing protein, partial [archaeon]|nr:methyltransferase domain-containing protein [archaeon]